MKPINSYDKKYLEHQFNELLFWMDSLRYDSKKLDLANIREHITEAYDKYLGIFKVLCHPEKKPWKKLREVTLIWCPDCKTFWWDDGENQCPNGWGSHITSIERVKMREVI